MTFTSRRTSVNTGGKSARGQLLPLCVALLAIAFVAIAMGFETTAVLFSLVMTNFGLSIWWVRDFALSMWPWEVQATAKRCNELSWQRAIYYSAGVRGKGRGSLLP